MQILKLFKPNKMKTIFLLVFNFLFLTTVFAQNTYLETTIRNSFFSYGEYIFAMDNGEDIIVGKDYMSGSYGNEILRLDKLDASGNLLWSNTYPGLTPDEAYFFKGAAKGTDNTFFIAGTHGLCDAFGYGDVMKFDVNGNLLWNKTVDSSGGNFIRSLITSNNGGVWVRVLGNLIELDNGGNILQNVPANFNDIVTYDYNRLTEDLVVFGGPISNRKLSYIGSSGNNYEIGINASFGYVKFLNNGMVALLIDNTLQLYDNQLNLTNSLNIPSVSVSANYTELTCDSQYIYAVNWATADSSSLFKVDYNLNMMDEFTVPFQTRDIDVKDDYVKMIGHEYKHTWIKNVNNDFNDTYANADIGVVNILVNAADSTYFSQFYDCNTHFEAEGIKAVVQNFGTEVIDYFEVNALYEPFCYFICYNAQASMMTYDNRNLLPGQLDTVDFPDLNLYWISQYSQLCLYTTRPNQLTDKDHDNDRICRNFFYNDIVNVEETGGLEPVEIFPNPTTGMFNIKGIAEGKYELLNVAGQVMQSGQLENDASIDISTFPQGVYFISLMVDNEQSVQRLVKI